MSSCTHPHIVVTGTSSGIGRATALRLAAAGYHVYAGVRRPTDAPVPPAASSGEITALPLDVTDPAQIAAAADTVAGHTGAAGLDGLVDNAGIGLFGPLEIIPIQQFRRLLEVNVTGQLAVTQALLPLLRRARPVPGRLPAAGRHLRRPARGGQPARGRRRGRGPRPDHTTAAGPLPGRQARRRMAILAALPTPVLDTLRRRQAHQPAPGSRASAPAVAHAAAAG